MSSMFCGLEAEVELLDDGLREQLHQRRRVGQRGDGDAADQAGRQPRQRGDVVAEALRDLRPLHLHHDLLAGAQPGGVHLGDGGGGDGRLVEPLEQLVERAAEVDLDHGPDVGERLGRHLVAQQLELADQLVGEEALARRRRSGRASRSSSRGARRRGAAGGRCRRATTGGATRTPATRRARRRSRPACG